MDIFEALTELESNPELHCARLLVLLEAFGGENGHGEIEGLTKLAKLDFLLRYPVMLERALIARNRSPKAAEIQPHERDSVESKMVRYRFGPWDHRYWRLLALLQGKGLIRVRRQGLARMVGLTEKGRALALELARSPEFQLVARRAIALRQTLNLNGTALMRFIYDTFPEIASMQMNEEITT